jgi:hypothetical protein
MHAMCNKGQRSQDAIALAEQFVSEWMELAIDLESWDLHGEALSAFGTALHTVQDATSPSHANLQVWQGTISDAIQHVSAESFGWEPPDSAYYATKALYNVFTGAAPVPDRYFNEDGSLWVYKAK